MAGEKGAGSGAGWLTWAGVAVVVVIAAFFALRPPPPAPPVAAPPVAEAPAPVTAPAPAAAPEAVAQGAPAEAPPEAPAGEAPPEVAEVPAETAAEAPAEAAAGTAAPVAEPAAEPPAAPVQPDPPRFDTVRVTPDGGATVAGRAAPGAEVSVLVDAETVAMATANAQGSFATLFTLPPSAAPRLLTLRMRTAEGAELASSDQVVLAAIAPAPDSATGSAPPEVVAEAPAEAADEGPAETPADTPAETPAEAPAETPAAILLTDEGVRVLQTGTQDPASPPRVTIDAISYTPEGEVRFAGRGLPGAVVRLYLDDAALADLPVAADGGWGDMVPGIAPGLYALRADMIDGTGAVLARFATPFRRETAERLAMAAGPKLPVAEAAPAAAPEAAPQPVASAAPAIAAPAPDATAAPAPPETTPETTVAPADAAPVAPVTVTVQPGFTLWGIAQDSFGSGLLYVQLFEVNRDQIRDPDLIYPGQVFTLPKLPD